MDEHVQPVVLYPTKQRKRKLDEKARAATAYATACSEGVDDDVRRRRRRSTTTTEGMYQAEPNEEGDACTVLAAGKLKTKRDEVGKNLGPMVETLLAEEERRKDSSMPICCCFTLDKVGQYEFGPFRCATVGYHLCNFCPCARSMAGHGQPGGCRRCREAGTEATCTHWDMATPATKQYFEDREKALAERVGTLPDQVLPFWRNKAEAKEIVRKLEIKLRSDAKLETIESAIRAKCDCLTVKLFLQELIFVLHIVNTKSWETDPSMPATFQGHADAMGKLMVEIWGPESITPYFHDIIAGHLRDMMELYGPLYSHQNEGQERFNGRLTGRKKRHSQNGGACNRGAELRASRGATVGKCDSIGTWAGRFALRSSGRADSVLDAATERRREERRDAAAAGPPRRAPNAPPSSDDFESEPETDSSEEEDDLTPAYPRSRRARRE
ncbi:hypothetical protein JL720_13916 [Aureococcus anophagefferens]|nr:hypothetical protein JL720_13916 [Aureococcus anophagefferens]